MIQLAEDGPGTCINAPPTLGPEVKEIPTVECAVEHTHEIFAVVNYVEQVPNQPDKATDLFPGLEALDAFAERRLHRRVRALRGRQRLRLDPDVLMADADAGELERFQQGPLGDLRPRQVRRQHPRSLDEGQRHLTEFDVAARRPGYARVAKSRAITQSTCSAIGLSTRNSVVVPLAVTTTFHLLSPRLQVLTDEIAAVGTISVTPCRPIEDHSIRPGRTLTLASPSGDTGAELRQRIVAHGIAATVRSAYTSRTKPSVHEVWTIRSPCMKSGGGLIRSTNAESVTV